MFNITNSIKVYTRYCQSSEWSLSLISVSSTSWVDKRDKQRELLTNIVYFFEKYVDDVFSFLFLVCMWRHRHKSLLTLSNMIAMATWLVILILSPLRLITKRTRVNTSCAHRMWLKPVVMVTRSNWLTCFELLGFL
jgi:hypothetical protein